MFECGAGRVFYAVPHRELFDPAGAFSTPGEGTGTTARKKSGVKPPHSK